MHAHTCTYAHTRIHTDTQTHTNTDTDTLTHADTDTDQKPISQADPNNIIILLLPTAISGDPFSLNNNKVIITYHLLLTWILTDIVLTRKPVYSD